MDLHDTSKFKFEMDPLPVISVNESAVRQLFTNLISNAVKYSSKAEYPAVSIRHWVEDGRDWFCIADNGIGIEPIHMQQLFKPFKRFTGQFSGNGLGLAIVKRIVEKHGGVIEAKPNPEGGMRFEFTLDLERRKSS